MSSVLVFKGVMFLTFLACSSLTAYILGPNEVETAARRRLFELRSRPATARKIEEEELKLPFSKRVVAPLLDRTYRLMARFTPAGLQEKSRRKLAMAGRPISMGTFFGLKLYLFLTALIMSIITGRLLWAAGLPAGSILLVLVPLLGAGFFGPEVWLSFRAESRRKHIRKAFPDVLDLLSVSVEAGLGFDGAMQKVGEKYGEPVGEEFRTYLKEMRLGRSRADSLRDLAERTQVPDLKTFAAAVIQADRLGMSISRVLRSQSDQMRQMRKQRAEENVMKTPLKMLFPLALFIFPTIFIVLLGPVVIHFLLVFSNY